VHLQLPSNFTDISVTTAPKMIRKAYTFNSTFKNSERVKISSIGQRIPDICYT